MDNHAFCETLSFRQPVLWILLLGLFAVTVGVQGYFYFRGVSGGGGLFALVLSAVIFLFVIGLLFMTRLETRVDSAGLHTRLYPLEITYRDLGWDEMTAWKQDVINPWRHGGWGLRLGKNSKAYIVSGNRCVTISLKNGKTLFVGTRRPEELAAALDASGEAKQ